MNRRVYLKTLSALTLVAMAPEAHAAPEPPAPWLYSTLLSCSGVAGASRPERLQALRCGLREQCKKFFDKFRGQYPNAKVERIEFRFEKADHSFWTKEYLWAQPDALRYPDIVARAIDVGRYTARREGRVLDPLEVDRATVFIFFRPALS